MSETTAGVKWEECGQRENGDIYRRDAFTVRVHNKNWWAFENGYMLAAFVRDLTDETPLTAQLLPSLGGEQYGESELMFRFGKVRVFAFGAPEQWTWGLFGTGRELKKWINPLTVGQLHLIRMYIEGRQ